MKDKFMISVVTRKMNLEGTAIGTTSEIIHELDDMQMAGQYKIYKLNTCIKGCQMAELVLSCESTELQNEFVKTKTEEIEQKYRKLFKGSMKDAIRILEQGLPDDWEE